LGFCRADSAAEIYRYGPHHGEEPPISGNGGSGTVFFSRCTLGCLYCQNYPWSREGKGDRYSVKELAAVLKDLKEVGCHNWNLVSPTPWLPFINDALGLLNSDAGRLPVVFNSSGYESVDTIAACAELADIYLVDLRYASEASAMAGSGVADYVPVARKAMEEMWRQAGPLKLDENGIAVSGVVCRLLILPGLAGEAVDNLEWMSVNLGKRVAVSVLAQYTPAYKAHGNGEWGRGITLAEYDMVRAAVEQLGFSEGWIQDLGETTSRNLLGFEMPAGGDSEAIEMREEQL